MIDMDGSHTQLQGLCQFQQTTQQTNTICTAGQGTANRIPSLHHAMLL